MSSKEGGKNTHISHITQQTNKQNRYRADVQKLNEEILELDEVLYGMEKEVEVSKCVSVCVFVC